jgi:hypothetical protein
MRPLTEHECKCFITSDYDDFRLSCCIFVAQAGGHRVLVHRAAETGLIEKFIAHFHEHVFATTYSGPETSVGLDISRQQPIAGVSTRIVCVSTVPGDA